MVFKGSGLGKLGKEDAGSEIGKINTKKTGIRGELHSFGRLWYTFHMENPRIRWIEAIPIEQEGKELDSSQGYRGDH